MTKLGAFALTEPEHGSDSVALETSARPDGAGWVLNGSKRWIGLGSVADLVVVWPATPRMARSTRSSWRRERRATRPGVIEGKVSLRSVWQAEITLDKVRVPAGNRLPGARSFKDTTRVLATTRSTCAWAALGHATAAYDAALRYALERRQFGEPLAGFQIIQQRLVSMLADLTAMQLYCLQIGRLAEAAADPHRRRAGQDAQHPQGARGSRRGPRHARRQRHPARLPGDASHGGPGGDPHLRGPRDHAGAHRRPRRSPASGPSRKCCKTSQASARPPGLQQPALAASTSASAAARQPRMHPRRSCPVQLLVDQEEVLDLEPVERGRWCRSRRCSWRGSPAGTQRT